MNANDTIQMGKQYRTRDGREVRIYAVDGGGLPDFHIHGAILGEGEWEPCQWAVNGTFSHMQGETGFDLVEVKPKITRTYWLRHSKNGAASYWGPNAEAECRRIAAQRCASDTFAITGPHAITFTEGEGLS